LIAIALMLTAHIYTARLFCDQEPRGFNLLIAFIFATAAACVEAVFYHNALTSSKKGSTSILPPVLFKPWFFVLLIGYGAITGIIIPILIKATCCWNTVHAIMYGARLACAILNSLLIMIIIAENSSLARSIQRLFYLVRRNLSSIITYISELCIVLGMVYLISMIIIGLTLILYWRSIGSLDTPFVLETTTSTISAIRNSTLAETISYFISNILFMTGLLMLYRSWLQQERHEVFDQIPPYMV